jgi:hypothetical protein
MSSKICCLLLLAVSIHTTAALADAAAVPAPAPAQGGIRISIKNEYIVKLDFGPLGKGTRDGTDEAKGVLQRQGSKYVGIVDADVDSTQVITGLVGGCGPATYEGSQKLKVIGHPVDGFNSQVQTVVFSGQTVLFNQVTGTGRPSNASNEYLMLEFAPETMTSQQPTLRRPDPRGMDDLVVSCHTLIDTLSGIAFLPLNDARWTMDGGGYIIALPSSGVLDYKETTVPIATGITLGPFEAKKSFWTIQVERLPQ